MAEVFQNCVSVSSRKVEASLPGPCPGGPTVFLHSFRFLCYPPLDKNEKALHCQEGRLCHLLHEKRGLLRSLSGDEKGGQHWRKTVLVEFLGRGASVQPFSQNARTPTVAKEFQIGLYDPAEADLKLF